MKINYVITEEDYEILHDALKNAKNPCQNCSFTNGTCMGCQEYIKYSNYMKKLKENNLDEIYNTFRIIKEAEKAITDTIIESRANLRLLEEIVGKDGLMSIFGYTKLELEKHKKGDED